MCIIADGMIIWTLQLLLLTVFLAGNILIKMKCPCINLAADVPLPSVIKLDNLDSSIYNGTWVWLEDG